MVSRPQTGTPSIGIVSESRLVAQGIAEALQALDFTLGPVLQLDQLERIAPSSAAAWVLALSDDVDGLLDLLLALECAGKPVLHGLDWAPESHALAYRPWLKRFGEKLARLLAAPLQQVEGAKVERPSVGSTSVGSTSAESKLLASYEAFNDASLALDESKEIWILAASLGGPEAVKAFVDSLPPDLDIALLYAQHIDAHFAQVLQRVLGRHAALDFTALSDGQVLQLNQVQMVPVTQRLEFQNGYCQLAEQAWSGPYGPNINELLHSALQAFGRRCHLIVFSGMAGDAVDGAVAMQHAGCEVWLQAPESCVQPAMPEAVLAALKPQLIARPEQLAEALVARSKGLKRQP